MDSAYAVHPCPQFGRHFDTLSAGLGPRTRRTGLGRSTLAGQIRDGVETVPTTQNTYIPHSALRTPHFDHGMSFSSRRALIMNCKATEARRRPMIRVVIFMAMGLSQRAPEADRRRTR